MISELTVLLTAAAPISELRGAIPLALEVYKFSLAKTWALALFGNFLPVPVILYCLGPIEKFFRRNKKMDGLFSWIYARTQKNFSGGYEKWGELALMIFVAIPLPVTGAWSGALAAHLFGIPKKKAAIFIFLGIVIAAIAVTLIDLGIAGGLKFLL